MRYPYLLITIFILGLACNKQVNPPDEMEPNLGVLQLSSISIGTLELLFQDENKGVSLDAPIVIRFSAAVDKSTIEGNISIQGESEQDVFFETNLLDNDKSISLKLNESLGQNKNYTISINDQLKGKDGMTFPGIAVSFTTLSPPLFVTKIEIDGKEYSRNERISEVSFSPNIKLTFSEPLTKEAIEEHSSLVLGSLEYNFNLEQVNDSTIAFQVMDELLYYRKNRLEIASELGDVVAKEFDGFQLEFYTRLDETLKYPEISDEELLTKVQAQTFKYFWDFGHPISGLARERNTSPETVTSGGSGFGIISIIIGIERGFISRAAGIERLKLIMNFLRQADRFHGVWPHWLNGSTGKVIPFSAKDNGGDLVETSYLAMALLTVRQYLNEENAEEKELISQIQLLWESIEWSWHTQGGQEVLYWHWSPDFGWDINLKISGYNEALITYILGASSPTFPIEADVYHNGWARNGEIKNGNTYYNETLPLGNQAMGGPLFFEHYTFLGIDPRKLKDNYADYWEQAINHTQINRAYCIDNPKNYIGYSINCWGLTASDNQSGYSAHSPTNDRGVITPTAALSSFPYTPEYSMEALHHFYYAIGDQVWKEYGFVDAFNFTEQWVAESYLAIDQGPIIIMIENYRTGLLWELFMSSPEIQQGLDKLGFTY